MSMGWMDLFEEYRKPFNWNAISIQDRDEQEQTNKNKNKNTSWTEGIIKLL